MFRFVGVFVRLFGLVSVDFCCLVRWLVVKAAGCFSSLVSDRVGLVDLVDWLDGWLIGWLVGVLVGWLLGWLNACYYRGAPTIF